MPAHIDPGLRRPGDRLIMAGGMLFALGALAVVAAVVPLLVDADRLPLAVYLLALLAPLGFAVMLAGLLASARSRRRR